MRQSIHSPFVFAAAVLLAVVCTGCSPAAKKARHLAEADRYFVAGQYEKAEIEYLNALQIEPLNSRAISQLGLMYFDEGRLGRVVAVLLKARELDPNNVDVRLKLGLMQFSAGNMKVAREEASFVLSRRPQDPDAPLLLAEASLQPKEIEDARHLLLSLPPPTPESSPVLLALGMFAFRNHDLKAAEEAFKRAQAQDPKSGSPVAALGALYWLQKNLPAADQALKAASDLSPPRSPKRLQYAQFKLQTGDIEGGRRLLAEMIKQTPDYLPALVLQAQLAGNEKKFDEAGTIIATVLSRDPAHSQARLMSAQFKLAKGDTAKGVVELESLSKLYPQSAAFLYQLALGYLANGETGKAVSTLNQSVALAPNFADAIVLQAKLNIRKGDFVAAVNALRQLVQHRPDIAEARLLLATAYRGQNDFDNALAVYRQFEESFSPSPEVDLFKGLVLLQQKKPAEARQEFNKAMALQPEYLPALQQLVGLDLADKQYAAARQRVEAQIAKNPKLAGLQMVLADIYLAQKDTTGAEAALQKAMELEPTAPAPYFLLARIYVGANQHEKAVANLQQILVKNPGNVEALMLVGVIREQDKDYPAARDSYEKLLAINPKFSPALNNLAWLYSEYLGDLDKAYDLAQKSRVLAPYQPHALDTLGWILYKRHQYAAALPLLEDSAGKLPTAAEIQYHLGLTHYMMGEEQSARIALQRALQLNKDLPTRDEIQQRIAVLDIDVKTAGAPVQAALEKTIAERKDDPVALSRLAAIYQKEGATEKAIRTYEAALKANPDNVGAALSLIRLYTAGQDRSKALELAKTTRKLAPDDPDIAHVLGRLTFQAGDYPRAATLLQESVRQRPNDPDVLVDFAEASYSVGRASEAETAMRHALEVEPSFHRATETRHFLELISLPAKPAELAAATAKIDATLQSEPASVPALMAKAAASEQRADAAAARGIYEKVLGIYPDFTPAKKRLVILYSANPADNQKAYDLALKAREAFPDDVELSRAMGIILYRKNDFARAVPLLQGSVSQRPQDAEAIYYLGMAQFRLNKRVESKQTLQRALALKLPAELAAEAQHTLVEIK